MRDILVKNRFIILHVVCVLLLALSLTVYAIQHIIIGPYYQQSILLTGVVSLTSIVLLYNSSWKDIKLYIITRPVVFLLVIIWVGLVQYYTFLAKSDISRTNLHALYNRIDLFTPCWYFFSGIFLCFFIIWIIIRFRNIFKNVFKEVSCFQKKVLFFGLAFIFVVLALLYSTNPLMYLQMDNVYSIDSRWTWEGIFSDPNYYDLRHPIMGELFFPIWAGINGFLKILGVNQFRIPMTILAVQMVNVTCIVIVSIIISKLSNNHAMILYLLSIPSMVYSLSIEKYQIPLLILVLYVYDTINDKDNIGMELIAISGMNPVFSLIWINELFESRASFLQNAKRLLQYFISGIFVLICTGRGLVFFLDNLFSQFQTETLSFRSTYYGIGEKLIGIMNLFSGCIIAIDSKITEPYVWPGDTSINKISFTWINVNQSVSVIGVIIIIVTLLGMWEGRKERFYRLCTGWLFVPFFMFLAMNLVPNETPVFAIFFSWALVPLFVKGIDKLTSIIEVSKKVMYAIIYTIVGCVNVFTIISSVVFLFGIKDSQL